MSSQSDDPARYLGLAASGMLRERPWNDSELSAAVYLEERIGRDHLGRVHLPVQELDHATQLARDLVGDNKHHPHLPRTQVLLDVRPELLDVGFLARNLADNRVRVVAVALALARKQLAHLLKGCSGPSLAVGDNALDGGSRSMIVD